MRGRFFLADTRFFAHQLTQVEQLGTANFTAFVENNAVDVWRIKKENTLNANAVRGFTHHESTVAASTTHTDYIAAIRLDTLFCTLDDSVVYSDVVARAELRKVRLFAHLLVNKFN